MPKKDKRQIYEEAGLGTGDLSPGDDPAIIVVDLQEAFTDPASAPGDDIDNTVEATADLVDVAHDNDVPVYYSRTVWRDDLRDGAVFAEKNHSSADSIKEGSEFLGLDPRLDVIEDDFVLEKTQVSVFFETGLDTLLTYEQIDTVLVVGISTSGCVRATVVDACQYGYIPIVVRECVDDRAEEPHEANLFDMQSKYAMVWDLTTAISYLEDPSHRPQES